MDFYQKYGSCTLVKNTYLFHSGLRKNDDPIFFGFHPNIAKIFAGSSDKIEIWQIKENTKLLFMINEVDCRSWTKSAIEEIYQYYFPHESQYDDIDIKHRFKSKRSKLIRKLKNQGLIGWFSSLENNFELEVCLFNQTIANHYLQLKDVVELTKYDSIDFENALKKAIVMPCQSFYDKSLPNLTNCPFHKYKKHIEDCIDYEINIGYQKKFSKNSNFTLRLKLKI